MDRMIYLAIGLSLMALLLAAVSQILFKIAANRTHTTKLAEYLNPQVITGYGLMGLSALLSMFSLRYLSVTSVTMIQSGGYVLIPLLSFVSFKEPIHRKQMLGMLLILAGLIVFTSA